MSQVPKKKLGQKSPNQEKKEDQKPTPQAEKNTPKKNIKKKRPLQSVDPPAKRQRIASTNAKGTPIQQRPRPGIKKKSFRLRDMRANLIHLPAPFSSVKDITKEISRWQTEGASYKLIINELGRILLGKEDDKLDADLSEDEAKILFPSDSPSRATRLTSEPFLRIIDSIAPNNEVEWLAELHHPIQECFKEFMHPGQSILAASFGNAVILQTTKTDQRLKPDRVFGWTGLKSLEVTPWVGTIQIPFVVIESKPASKLGQLGDLYKKFILEAKAYEQQEACKNVYDITPEFNTTICLPLVFGIYMVGAEFTFDVYRVIDGKKKPLSFDPINFRTYSRRVLRAIIAIKGWAKELRENMFKIQDSFETRLPKEDDDDESDQDGDELDRDDTEYQGDEDGDAEGQGDSEDSNSGEQSDSEDMQDDGESQQDTENMVPSDYIQLHQSSKTSVVARFDKRRGCYVVTKTTLTNDVRQEAELLQGTLKSASFVPQLLGVAIHDDDEATLTMSWHAGQHPHGFTNHRELKRFLRTLLKHVNQIHERGIVHNDLKEENVLWDSNTSTLTIIDFGGADTYPSYSNVGTNGYMAPDRLRTRASDVYSCGVIFLNLLLQISIISGEQVVYLRRCNSVEDLVERIAPFLPVNVSLWHSGAWDLAKRMTDSNPNKRITIKKALQHAYLV